MKAGINYICALTLAATPLLGCAGSQQHDNRPSPTDSSVPASGSRSGYDNSQSGAGQSGAGTTSGDTTGAGAAGNQQGTGDQQGTGNQGYGNQGYGNQGTGMGTGAGTGTGTVGAGTSDANKQVVVTLDPKSGSKMTGSATFSMMGGKVALTVSVQGAPPGVHGVHIHQNGDCSSADAESAGPHWNPTKDTHGKMSDMGHHLGDIGNITVGADGTGTLTVTSDRWTIGTGGDTDISNHAVVIHSKADDFKSQPSGGSGGRIACGVIQKK